MIGVGTLTAPLAIVAATVPQAPTALTRDDANTSKTQVAFTWSAPTDNGGVAVIDYSISWDQGTSTYVSLATGVTLSTYLKTGLLAGTTYKFKVSARNSIGTGSLSSEFSIVAATIPSTPAAPITTYDGLTDTVSIDFESPTDDGGLTVHGYVIKIQR